MKSWLPPPGFGHGRQDLKFILQALTYEAKVGQDDSASLLGVIEGLPHVEQICLHEGSHADGR